MRANHVNHWIDIKSRLSLIPVLNALCKLIYFSWLKFKITVKSYFGQNSSLKFVFLISDKTKLPICIFRDLTIFSILRHIFENRKIKIFLFLLLNCDSIGIFSKLSFKISFRLLASIDKYGCCNLCIEMQNEINKPGFLNKRKSEFLTIYLSLFYEILGN